MSGGRAAVIGLCVGAALTTLGVARVISSYANNLAGAPALAGAHTSVPLSAGTYAIYEDDEDSQFPIAVDTIQVNGPRGEASTAPPHFDVFQVMPTWAKTSFVDVILVAVPTTGKYDISLPLLPPTPACAGVCDESGPHLIVGKAPYQVAQDDWPWFAVAVAGLVVVVIGGLAGSNRGRLTRVVTAA